MVQGFSPGAFEMSLGSAFVGPWLNWRDLDVEVELARDIFSRVTLL